MNPARGSGTELADKTPWRRRLAGSVVRQTETVYLVPRLIARLQSRLSRVHSGLGRY
jgi:hypothetical protein